MPLTRYAYCIPRLSLLHGQVYYGCYETCTPGEIAVVAERAAMNMAHQPPSVSIGFPALIRFGKA